VCVAGEICHPDVNQYLVGFRALSLSLSPSRPFQPSTLADLLFSLSYPRVPARARVYPVRVLSCISACFPLSLVL